jgi:hypothetical protein
MFIQCPCLIHTADGTRRCNQKFRSKDDISPSSSSRGSNFMRHYTSTVHKNSETPQQVKEWFPYACTTSGCKNRFRKDWALKTHKVRCVDIRNTARITSRQTDLERQQLTDNARTRRRNDRTKTSSTVTTPDHRDETTAAEAERPLNDNAGELAQDTEQESESQNQSTQSTYDVFQQRNVPADLPQSTQSTYNVYLQSSSPAADRHT